MTKDAVLTPDQSEKNARGCALIADDDEFFRVAARGILRDYNGFTEVIESATFAEAVAQRGRYPSVEIGLFDLNMPGMNNWADLKSFRADFPDTQLVVVSASRQSADILEALSIGASGFIHKGSGVTELSRAIGMICEGHVYVPPFLPHQPVRLQTFHGLEQPRDAGTGHTDVAMGNGSPQAPKTLGKLHFTQRQREITRLLIRGYSNKQMARELGLSEGTIKFHLAAVLRLLGVTSRLEAATRVMKLFNDTDD